MQIEPYSLFGSEILSQPTPRRVRLTAYGFAAYGSMAALFSAMVLGPPISFFRHDIAEKTLLQRGVLTRFDLTASKPTRQGDEQSIDYVFEAQDVTGGGASMRQSSHSVVSNSDMAAFADLTNRNVIYDPANPANATPVTNRSALARRRDYDRKIAILACPLWLAIVFSVAAVGVSFLRRKLRLLRSGLAAAPTMTRCQEGRARVQFRFTDADGKSREGWQSYNFRVGFGASFAPYLQYAVVFYHPDDPKNCDLFLPLVSTFRFARA